MQRGEALAALLTRCWCGRDLGVHEVPCPDVPFPTAMLRLPHLRQSTLSEFWQCHLLSYFKQEHENGWHSQPQARGSFFHLWAAGLLRHLEVVGRDKLRDEPECDNPACQARPNEEMTQEEFEARREMYYAEGEVCPTCGEGVLHGRALEDVAVDMLLEALRQQGVPDEDRLPLPYGEHMHDLLWIVRKFAREQSFTIDRLVDVEHRYRTAIHYPNPFGGMVERIFSGQMDAVFLGATNDHLVVLDWKDTWAIPGPASISAEGYFQQRAYALLLMAEHEHVNAVTLREVYVRFSAGESGEDNHRTATIYRSQLPTIRHELAVIAEAFDLALEEGHERPVLWFNPSPGSHCNFCPLPHKCPAWDSYEELKDAGPLQSMDEAEEAAGLLTVAKRVVKLMELRVKGFVSKPGPRPSVPVHVETGKTGKDGDPDALTVYKDKRPGLPPGVPIKTAKGQKVYAFVEGSRTSKPEPHEVEAALEARARGIPVRAEDLYRTGTTTTFRLVELAVPVDDDVAAQAARVSSEGDA
jgi:hypothetical protein